MKNLAKFAVGGVLIVLAGLGILIAIRYLRYRNDPAYQNEQAAYEYVEQEKKLIQQMKDDPYGGDTPEQTLALFIDALKKGDTDLASKYFVVGEWERQKNELSMFDQTKIDRLIDDIEKDITVSSKRYKDNNEIVFERTEKVSDGFVETNGKRISVPSGNYTQTTVLRKNQNGKWKIVEL